MKYFKVYFFNGSVSYSMAPDYESVCNKYSEFPVVKIEEM